MPALPTAEEQTNVVSSELELYIQIAIPAITVFDSSFR